MTLTEITRKAWPLRYQVARGLLYVAKAVAPLTIHSEATREGRQLASLTVGTTVVDMTGLSIEVARRILGAEAAADAQLDDEDGDDW